MQISMLKTFVIAQNILYRKSVNKYYLHFNLKKKSMKQIIQISDLTTIATASEKPTSIDR